jgi:hypothetical protein
VQELLSDLSKTLTAFGGTAGILRDQAPRRWTPGSASTP